MKFLGKAYTKFISLWLRAEARDNNRVPSPILLDLSDENAPYADQVVAYNDGKLAAAVRTTDNQGKSTSADIYEDGTLLNEIRGKSLQGETGNQGVCQTLIEALNLKKDGRKWGELKTNTRKIEVDCEASDGESIVEIQVTRIADQRVWKELARFRRVPIKSTINAATDTLRDAIRRKSDRLAPSTRAKLVLALDATETPIYSFPEIIEAFKNRYGLWATQQGFNEIWAVGPTAKLTKRLDKLD